MAVATLRGLTRAVASIQSLLEILARTHPLPSEKAPAFLALEEQVRGMIRPIEQSLLQAGITLQDLAAPSQRGLLWLSFLTQPGCLRQHISTLAEVNQIAERVQARAGRRKPAAWRSAPIQTRLYNSTTLVLSHLVKGKIELVIHEEFCGAPKPVLEALVEAALAEKKPAALARIRQYTRGPAFQSIREQMAIKTPRPVPGSSRGQFHQLEEVFQRVNQAYFSGRVARPALVWSKTHTRRKFGHYDFTTDTVMLSRSLDSAGVPDYVLDSVMHHELLHKFLGVKVVNGRRLTHTPEFRAAERQFARHREAEDFLKQLAAG